MKNIKDIFISVLLKEKNVAIRPEDYKKYFHVIIPDYDLFLFFLQSNSTEKMIAAAKEISETIFFDMNHSPTTVMYNSLLDAETNDMEKDSNNFISQDHVIHSVNVYLLGIYFFFNHKLFHDKLWSEFSYNADSKMEKNPLLRFVAAWKIFSFCHDIGYAFERLIENDGTIKHSSASDILEKCYALDEEILYDQIIKAVSIFIVITEISRLSEEKRRNFTKRFNIQEIKFLNNVANEYREKIAQNNYTNCFVDDFTQLQHIHSPEDIQLFYPYITKQDIITVSCDDSCNVVSVEFFDGTKISRNNKEATIEASHIYFCYKLEKCIQDRTADLGQLQYLKSRKWSELAQFLCEPELSLVTNCGSDCKSVVIAVYRKIKNIIGPEDLNIDYSLLEIKRKSESRSIEKMQDFLISKIRSSMEVPKYRLTYLQSYLIIGSKILKLILNKKTLENTLKYCASSTNREMEQLEMLWQIGNDIRQVINQKYPKLFIKTGLKKKKYCCYPLQYDALIYKPFSDKFSQYIDFLTSYLDEIGLINNNNLQLFSNYSPSFSKYDHGIFSAHILIYSAACEKIFESESNVPILSTNLSRWEKNHSHDEDVFMEAVGAISVHNIYNDRYYELTGVKFKLSLDNHPLAFFGAFCDALQLWDRHHSIDQSKCVLTDFNPSGRNFSIAIDNKQIVLTCESISERKTGHYQRKNLSRYLAGADTLLKVNVIEKNYDVI